MRRYSGWHILGGHHPSSTPTPNRSSSGPHSHPSDQLMDRSEHQTAVSLCSIGAALALCVRCESANSHQGSPVPKGNAFPGTPPHTNHDNSTREGWFTLRASRVASRERLWVLGRHVTRCAVPSLPYTCSSARRRKAWCIWCARRECSAFDTSGPIQEALTCACVFPNATFS